MDILVLDAPMKFIHRKMVEQGAEEWSRYLTSQFNPLGRGTLYSQSFDKDNGLRVYLYSAAVTLECVGESKGYLKVVKAEETDVIAYHKAIEEGKLLEEKITFVPVYKFQYINGKEHHDVERFMEMQKEKRDLQTYIEDWKTFIVSEETEEVTMQLENPQIQETLKALYTGQTANRKMKTFMPEVENLKALQIKEINYDHYTMQYDRLSDEQKQVLERTLSTEDLYFINRSQPDLAMPLIREMVWQVTQDEKRALVIAEQPSQVDAILEDLENHLMIETAHLQQVEATEEPSQCALESKEKKLREVALNKLNEEASKHNRHKEELDQMKAECELYQNADKTIKLCFDILSLLEEIEAEKIVIQEESQELGATGMEYASLLEKYHAIPEKRLQVYQKIKEKVEADRELYNEMVWMKINRGPIEYQNYKELILAYSKAVQSFEEKLTIYQNEANKRSQYEEEYKRLEAKLLELRRQYLKAEALKQVHPHGEIQADEEITKEMSELEEQLLELKHKKQAHETGLMSTRYLDELKEQVYKLKEDVEVYMVEHKAILCEVYHKEEVTKAEAIEVFKCMAKIETLFEDEDYEDYLEGLEEYFKLEGVVEQNKELIKLQEANQKKMGEILKKQSEVMSLLSTKLEEKEFKAFIKLIDEGEGLTKQVLNNPLGKESVEGLEKLEEAVQQREFKLRIYKEKVDFYEELAKLKEDWQHQLMENGHMFLDYLVKRISVVGATCKEIEQNVESVLMNDDFEYVIIEQAQQILGLELLVPMIRGRKVVLIGDAESNRTSLFARLYEACPKDNKSLLKALV